MSRYHFWNFYICKHSYTQLSLCSTHPRPGLCQQKCNQGIKGCDYYALLNHLLGHTQNNVQFWSPIIKLERIQQGITRMIREFQNLKNEEKQKEIGLLNLKKRLLRGENLITVLQYWRIFMDKMEILLSLFFMRTIRHWNRLPRELVECLSQEIFKAYLHRALGNIT